MGKASQAKKVNRAAATGGGRTAGKNTPVAWYASLFVVLVLGVMGVFVASRNLSNTQAAAEGVPPVANKDHWHAAYGFNLCGQWAGSLGAGPRPDSSGIHTHDDGLVHAEPVVASAAGKNATFEKFMKYTSASVTATSVDLRREGAKFKNGDKCGDKRGELTWWVFESARDTTGKSMRGNPANWRIADGSLIAISFNPKGFKVTQPPSAAELPTASEPEPAPPGAEVPPPTGEPPTGEPPPTAETPPSQP